MYQQFALTIAISVLISAFNALSLTPALCAIFLRPHKPMWGPLGLFFKGFNKVFEVTTNGYVSMSRLLVRRSLMTIVFVGAVIVGAGFFASNCPPGSSPTRTRASWASTCSSRRARRSSAPASC